MAFGIAQVLTTVGKTYTASQMAGTTTVTPKFLAIGTGATTAARTAAVGDIALSTEVETRVGTNAPTNTLNVFQVIQTITATAARAIDEAGLFSAITDGTMIVSATFAQVNLAIGDSIQITTQITYN